MSQWFSCRILGEDFPGALIGLEDPVGFYTTRAVLAGSAQEAEIAALSLLRADAGLQLRGDIQPSPDARIVFEYIRAVEADEGAAMANTGFTWFPMETVDRER